MYVATPSAWKPNVNKGLIWILCITQKCSFITFWMTLSNSEAHIRGPIRTSCCYHSIAWMLPNVCLIGRMILYSNIAFEMLVPLGWHRSNCRLSWLALKWCNSGWFTWWANASVSYRDVSSQIITNSLCPERSTKLKWPLDSKGFRVVQIWPCLHGTGCSYVSIFLSLSGNE